MELKHKDPHTLQMLPPISSLTSESPTGVQRLQQGQASSSPGFTDRHEVSLGSLQQPSIGRLSSIHSMFGDKGMEPNTSRPPLGAEGSSEGRQSIPGFSGLLQKIPTEATGPREKLFTGDSSLSSSRGDEQYPRLPSVSSITSPLVGTLSGGNSGKELAAIPSFSELNRHLIQKSKPSPEFPSGLTSTGAPPALPRGALGERATDRMLAVGGSRALSLATSEQKASSAPDIFRQGAMGHLPAPKPSLPAPRLRYNLPESASSPIAVSVRSVLDSNVAPFRTSESVCDLFPKAPANSPTLGAIACMKGGKDTPLNTKYAKNELVALKLNASESSLSGSGPSAGLKSLDDGCAFLLKAALELASSPLSPSKGGINSGNAQVLEAYHKKSVKSGESDHHALISASHISATPGVRDLAAEAERSKNETATPDPTHSAASQRSAYTRAFKESALRYAKEVVPGGKGPGSTRGMRAAAEELNLQVTQLREWSKHLKMSRIGDIPDSAGSGSQHGVSNRASTSPRGHSHRSLQGETVTETDSLSASEVKADSPGAKARVKNLLVDVSGDRDNLSPRSEKLRDRRWWAIGKYVEVFFDGDWWQATVLDVKPGDGDEGQLFVDYVGGGEEEREWVSTKGGRVRPPTEEWNKTSAETSFSASLHSPSAASKSPMKSSPKPGAKPTKDKAKSPRSPKVDPSEISGKDAAKKRAVDRFGRLESPVKKKMKTDSPKTQSNDGAESPGSSRRRSLQKSEASRGGLTPRGKSEMGSFLDGGETDFGADRAMTEAMKIAMAFKQEERGASRSRNEGKHKGDDKSQEAKRPESPKRYRGVSLHLGKWTSRAHLKMQVRRPGEGRTINLGTFETPEVAAKVHDVYWYYRLGPVLSKEYLNLPDFVDQFLAEKHASSTNEASRSQESAQLAPPAPTLATAFKQAYFSAAKDEALDESELTSPRSRRAASREGSAANSPRPSKRGKT